MLGMRISTLKRMLVAIAISALTALGMNLPANAQDQQQNQQDKHTVSLGARQRNGQGHRQQADGHAPAIPLCYPTHETQA